MLTRPTLRLLLASIYVGACTASAPLHAQKSAQPGAAAPRGNRTPSAAERMSQPGPEARELARRTGTWDVVMSIRPAPDAQPIVTRGVAERSMIGLYRQELMRPAPGMPDFHRIEYLTYNRVAVRWEYVSMDTRFPVGVMPAWSFGKGNGREITLYFESLPFVGLGREVEGRYLRSRHVVTLESADRDVTRQYWTFPGGEEYLAVQYEYTRRR